MTRVRHPSFAFCLAALLALTGLHVGMARGQAKVAGSIVICTGTGPVSIVVDANGKPTGKVRTCPDCVMTVLSGVAATADLPARVTVAARATWPRAARPHAGGTPHTARARDPPVTLRS